MFKSYTFNCQFIQKNFWIKSKWFDVLFILLLLNGKNKISISNIIFLNSQNLAYDTLKRISD